MSGRSLGLSLAASMAVGLLGPANADAAEAARDPAAVRLLEQSITAHASGPVRVRLSFRGTTTSPDQGSAPDGPSRPHPWSVDIALDEAAQAFALRSDIGIDGEFTFPRIVGFAGGKGFATRYTGEYDPVSAMPTEANGQLPHLQLKTILNTAKSMRVVSDPRFDRVDFSATDGPATSLLFDRATHLLIAQRRPPTPSAFGDRALELVYGPYRQVGAVMVPEAIALRFDSPALGPFEYSLSLTASAIGGPVSPELVPPAGARERKPVSTAYAVERFGDSAFLLRNVATEGQFSYNVLVVPFADHVLVVEAALNDAASRKVIEEVARLAPGKPIRTLVQTHHHGDHIGGIRTYVAAGTRILTPVGTRAIIERIAATHSAVAPDALARAPRPALIEEVAGERTIRDSANQVRLLDFPNGHSGRMLVVYVPSEKLVYQGDPVSAGELPVNPTTTAFLDWVRARKLDVQVLAGLHGRTLTGGEVRELLRDGIFHASPPAAPQ